MKHLCKIQGMYLFNKSSFVLLLGLWISCLVFLMIQLDLSNERINTHQAAMIYLGDTDFLLEQVIIVFSIFFTHQAFSTKQDAFIVFLLAKKYKRSHIYLSKCLLIFTIVFVFVTLLLTMQRAIGLLGYEYFYSVVHAYTYYMYFYLVTVVYVLYAMLFAQLWDSFFGALILFLFHLFTKILDAQEGFVRVYKTVFPSLSVSSTITMITYLQIMVLISCIFCINMVIYTSKDIHLV